MSEQYVGAMFDLTGKTAVVTGGGGTLGRALGAGLARAGANVILWDVRQEALAAKQKVLAEACGKPERIRTCEVDLMDDASVAKALAKSMAMFAGVDILLNACGGNRGKAPLVDTKVEDYEFVLKLNLVAGFLTPTQALTKYWIEGNRKGTVINIASMAGYSPLSGVWAYSAAKAAVMNQTQLAAAELARHGIRVNAIAPGFFLADQNRALLIDEATEEPTPRGREVLSRTPFNRFGEPEELVGVCLFLASEAASGFVSGVTIPVDGGYLCNNI